MINLIIVLASTLDLDLEDGQFIVRYVKCQIYRV